MNIFQLLKNLVNRCFFWRRGKEKKILLEGLRQRFERDFLRAYDFYQSQCANHISLDEYKTEKINYVRSWAEGVLELTPDPEQAAAIGAVEGNRASCRSCG